MPHPSVPSVHRALRGRFVYLAALAAVAAVATARPGTGSTAHAATSPARTTGGLTRLARGAHPLARAELDIGRLDGNKRIENLSLVFKLSSGQLTERDALVEAVSNPASPQFRQWLTPAAYAARFGAKPADIARASAWLASQGLDVSATPSPLGARLRFGGTVANLEAAFGSEMHRYRIGPETHYAMTSAPSVLASLADIVLAVHNTHDFYPRATAPRARLVAPASLCPNGLAGALCNQTDAGSGSPAVGGEGIAPPDWASIYDVAPLYTTGINGTKIKGAGVTVVVVGISPVAPSDLSAYWTTYGITRAPITQTPVPGTGATGEQGNPSAIEGVIDTEWAGAIAPDAAINYVVTGDGDQNVDDATYYAIEQNLGSVISESWTNCEGSMPGSDVDVLQTYGSAASLLGITYVVASGDSGAAGCTYLASLTPSSPGGGLYVSVPSSFPGVTAVGGTGFASPGALAFDGTTNVATGYPSAAGAEAAWSEGNDPNAGIGESAGGVSVFFARPSYQTQTAAPTCASIGSLPRTGITASAMRQVPDIAFTSGSGEAQFPSFIECTFDPKTYDCSTTGGAPKLIAIGGTSVATPAFAGVVALANQAAGGRLGNINPVLYALPAAVLHDVTTGNNEVVCKPGTDPGCPASGAALYGYEATTGFDCVTGLGSMDATKFVTQVAGLTATTTTLAAITSPLTEGAAVPLTATVNVTGTTNPNALGGEVTFAFQSYLANGAPDLSWTLGTASIANGTSVTGSASPAPAFAIPPGLVNAGAGVDVVATYGGDSTHLPSISPKVHVTFAPVDLCLTPGVTTASPGGTVSFTATGGVPPITWLVAEDTTSLSDGGSNGAKIDAKTGVLKLGSARAGYVLVAGYDSAGAKAFSEITVGAPTGSSPWEGDSGIAAACGAGAGDAGTDAGGTDDSGVGGGTDAGLDSGPGAGDDAGHVTVASGDGGADDAGTATPTPGSSGCSCVSAGTREGAPMGALGCVALGLGMMARRRRSRSGSRRG